MAWTAFALAFGLLGLGTGVAERAVHRAASVAIADRLNATPQQVVAKVDLDSVVGPLIGRYGTIRVSASGFRLTTMPAAEKPSGNRPLRAARLVLDLRSFQLGALHVRGMRAAVPDVRFEASIKPKPSIRFLGSGEGEGVVWTDATALAQYAKHRFESLDNVRVSFRGDFVVLQAEGNLLWSRSDIWVAGRPIVSGRRRIGIQPTRVLLDGTRLEGPAFQAWVAWLSQLIDLDRDLGLSGSMDATEVCLTKDRIEVRGVVRIPKLQPTQERDGVSSGHAGTGQSARVD